MHRQWARRRTLNELHRDGTGKWGLRGYEGLGRTRFGYRRSWLYARCCRYGVDIAALDCSWGCEVGVHSDVCFEYGEFLLHARETLLHGRLRLGILGLLFLFPSDTALALCRGSISSTSYNMTQLLDRGSHIARWPRRRGNHWGNSSHPFRSQPHGGQQEEHTHCTGGGGGGGGRVMASSSSLRWGAGGCGTCA